VRALIGCLLVLLLWSSSAYANQARSATGYRRGKPFKIRLVEVGGALLEERTARAFRAMQSAAAHHGIQLVVRSGFRPHEKQQALYRRYRAGTGNLAARPGYSNHQSGTALDIIVRDPDTLAWMEEHGPRFGFRQTVRIEPWHWELVAKKSARELEKVSAALIRAAQR